MRTAWRWLPGPARLRGLAAGAVSVLLLQGCTGDELTPPIPEPLGVWVDTLPAVPPSTIDLPVRYDLGPAMAWLESTVPGQFGDMDTREQLASNTRISYAYSATRTPFRISLRGRTASLATTVSYMGKGWYDPPLLPPISGSCGTDGTPLRARLVVETTVNLTERWELRPRTRVRLSARTDEDRDRCEVTVIGYDLTDRVLEAARAALQRELRQYDRQLASFDLEAQVREVWSLLQAPLRLTDSLWLVINPEAVRIGTLRAERDTLVTSVGLTAFPRIVGGTQPASSTTPMPPPDETGGPPGGLNLLTEARVGYDVASDLLTRELRGETIQIADRTLSIEQLELRGVGDGRISIGLRIGGAARGILYAVGTPAFDPDSALLTIPDLQYDVATRNLLVGALAWLAQDPIEQYLRTRVRINLAGVLEDGRALVERELNRELAPGVTLRVAVGGLEVLAVAAAPEALLARAVASGRGELTIELRPRADAARVAP